MGIQRARPFDKKELHFLAMQNYTLVGHDEVVFCRPASNGRTNTSC
jgi:hypothetical protein